MTVLRQRIVDALPSLRRYACALVGDRRTGDQYIRIALEMLSQEPWRIQPSDDVKFELYKAFHDALDVRFIFASDPSEDGDDADPYRGVKRGLLDLPLVNRKLLLLVTVEGFSLKRAAELLRLPEREAKSRLARARMELRCLTGASRMGWREKFFQQRYQEAVGPLARLLASETYH